MSATSASPCLPFSLDPLIAEAKRRARRRRYIGAALLLCAAAVGAAAFSLGGSRLPVMKPLPGMNIAKTGRAVGTPWLISAADSGDGRYGMAVNIAGSQVASKGGRFYVPGLDGRPVRLGWVAKSGGRLPFVAGAVAFPSPTASEHVTIRLSDGTTRTTTATVPPYRLTLVSGIAFFFAPIPRGTHPVAITAHDAAGHVVAWKRRG
jgi:hypothetical protein